MLKDIVDNLKSLGQFSGRTSREAFWPYAIAAFVVAMIVFMIPFMILMSQMMTNMMQFAAEHPDQASTTVSPGGYSVNVSNPPPELMAPMQHLAWVAGPAFAVALLALGAAIARRLHDRNMAGYWGLMPTPFFVIALLAFPRLISQVTAGGDVDTGLFGLLFLNNMLYIGGLIGLIVLLCGRSTPDANRYGPRPMTAKAQTQSGITAKFPDMK